ncbi:MAG: caspase family protein [Proteobacteria bacterium]|nr:caspase family protein [Pseudomonadota bacterium]
MRGVLALAMLVYGLVQAEPPVKTNDKNIEPPRLVTQRGHSEMVTSVAISPDGKIAVSGGTDKTLILWDVATGRVLRTLAGHEHSVKCVAFSPDGKTIASGSWENETIKLWDVATGQELRTLVGQGGYIFSAAFSPDGKAILSLSWNKTTELGSLKLWDVATGQELRTLGGQDGSVRSAAFSPDGSTIVSFRRDESTKLGSLKLWDVATGHELLTFAGRKDILRYAAFSPDGKTVVSLSRNDTSKQWSLKLWNVVTGEEVRNFEGNIDIFSSASFSPDGDTLMSWSWAPDTHTLKRWNVATGQELQTRTFRASPPQVSQNSAFSTDGTTMVAGDSFSLFILHVATGQQLRTLKGHTEWITSVAFAPDGQMVVSRSSDIPKTLNLWNLFTDSTPRKLSSKAKRGGSNSVSGKNGVISPDGKTLVAGSLDDTIKLWEVATGREMRTIGGPGERNGVMSVAFSPDGKTVVSGSGEISLEKSVVNTLKLWDVATGRKLRTLAGHADSVTSVAFSPDGKTIISGSKDNTLKVWDMASGLELLTISGHGIGGVASVAVSPDGKTVFTGGFDWIKAWDIVTGKEIGALGKNEYVKSIAVSPDGKTLVWGDRNKLKLWDVTASRELRTLVGHGETLVHAVAFSPDGKTVVSGCIDGSMKLWDVATGQELRTLGEKGVGINSVAFSPDGKTVVPGRAIGPLELWDVDTGRKRLAFASKHSHGITSVAYSPDGKTIVSGSLDKTIKLWNSTTGKELRTFDGHGAKAVIVAISPDGKFVVSGNDDKTLTLWDLSTGQAMGNFAGHGGNVKSVGFSPDGKTVVSGSDDKTLKLWDATSGRELRTLSGHARSVEAVAFSPDGKTLVSGSYDKTLRLWDATTGRELRTIGLAGEAQFVSSVDFSPDGKIVVSGSRDGTINLWDVFTGRKLQTITGHENLVTSINFSPDGEIVVSGSWDGTVKLWRVKDGTLLATLTSFTDGRWAVTDAEGRFDVADLEDMPHLHWVMSDDPMTPLPLEIFMRDYYEPRLLSRIMNGEKFKSVRALTDLKRVQPAVRITGVEIDPRQAGYVIVKVEVAGARRSYTLEGPSIVTAVHDLRLFRNGQMVGYVEGKLADAGGKPSEHTFRVRLPAGKAPLEFAAYAFNDDRVKSATARQTYTSAEPIIAAKPRAYFISIGVNRHDNPAWDLRYAVNDARQIGQSLASRLAGQQGYEAIISIPLLSDSKELNRATKANLKAVLDVLAGRKADVHAIPGGEQLRQATPDDLVLISFSGHGYNEGGLFYLIPGDTGPGKGNAITPELITHSISSDELGAWLREVDAGDMAMIVDACHSAASVGSEFKPGPMGSRGLGQLAFDKGMRILAASQADDVALESELIKHGLLSFALIQDGLDDRQADYQPRDRKIMLAEWLNYGVDRVPTLLEDLIAGKVMAPRGSGNGRAAVSISRGSSTKSRALQQPSLFDFTKGRRDVVLEIGM